MNVEEYRNKNRIEVETESGMKFKLRTIPIQTYDELMSFMDDKGIDPENPDEKIVRKYPGKLAEIIIPPASVEPPIYRTDEEVEDPSSELSLADLTDKDSMKIVTELMREMGATGEKAEKMENFRGEESTG